jgi:hypothetical protein
LLSLGLGEFAADAPALVVLNVRGFDLAQELDLEWKAARKQSKKVWMTRP